MEGVSILYIMADDFDNTEYSGAKQFFEEFGCSSTVAGTENSLTGLHGTVVSADILISQINLTDYDCIYIPGGPASGTLAAMSSVTTLIHEANTKNITMAAICGGPLVFAAAGIITGRKVTGHYSIELTMTQAGGIFTGNPVEIDKNLITADYLQTYASCIAVLQVLGYYETNPPTIGEANYELVDSDTKCNFDVQISDTFGVDKVKLFINTIDKNNVKTLFRVAFLTDDDCDSVFIGSVTGIVDGNYAIDLYTQDNLMNNCTTESIFTFTVGPTNAAGFNFTVIGSFVAISSMVIINKSRKHK